MFEDSGEFLAETLGSDYQPARSGRQPHPKGFEPGVRREPGRWLVTTPPMEMLSDEDAWATAVSELGVMVPQGWRVRVVEMRYDPVAWTREADGQDAVTRPAWRFKFAVEEDPQHGTNIEELVKELSKGKAATARELAGEGTFVIAWNDWQLFKAVGDGIEGTVRRVFASFDESIRRVKELRKLGRAYPRLLVVASGDLVEGCEIYPHQAYELQGDSRDQENAGRRLIVEGIKRLAPHFSEVHVLAVGGNHGERRVDGKKVNRHDNADCKVFEQAQDIIVESGRYPQVTFSIPREDLAATVQVEGWVLATTHGHIAGRASGGPEVKIKNWFKGQAAGKLPAGDADVLVTSHYHHARLADWGGAVWLQAPAMDGGSPQHADLTGEDAKPGLLTFGVTPTERVRDYEVIWL